MPKSKINVEHLDTLIQMAEEVQTTADAYGKHFAQTSGINKFTEYYKANQEKATKRVQALRYAISIIEGMQ